MKRSLILFVVLLFITLITNAQDIPEKVKGGFRRCDVYASNYRFGLLVKESRYKEASYIYDLKGFKIEYTYYNQDSSIIFVKKFVYDSKGNKIEESKFDSLKLNYKQKFVYDAKGNIIEMEQYNSEMHLDFRNIFKLDDKGNIIEKINIISDSSKKTYNFKIEYYAKGNKVKESQKTYKYDERNLLLEEVNYNNNNTIDVKYSYSYNNKSKLVEMAGYKFPNNILLFKSNFKYDELGNLTEEINYRNTDSPNGGKKYKYDNYSNLLEVMIFENSSEIQYKTEYIYSK